MQVYSIHKYVTPGAIFKHVAKFQNFPGGGGCPQTPLGISAAVQLTLDGSSMLSQPSI